MLYWTFTLHLHRTVPIPPVRYGRTVLWLVRYGRTLRTAADPELYTCRERGLGFLSVLTATDRRLEGGPRSATQERVALGLDPVVGLHHVHSLRVAVGELPAAFVAHARVRRGNRFEELFDGEANVIGVLRHAEEGSGHSSLKNGA